MTEKLFTKKFHAPYFRAANLIVWKFYIETGTVHVCTGSDWFGSYICRDIVCCYNPDHSFVTAWRYLGGQGRQTEYYGGVRRIDWCISFMCDTILVGKQCHCRNQYVAYLFWVRLKHLLFKRVFPLCYKATIL